MSLFVLLALLLCMEAPVFSSVTPVFVQKGGDVTLEVTESDVPEGFLIISWKFSTNDVLVSFSPGNEPRVHPDYSGRIEFVKKLYFVKLKNLQKTDSGVYTSRVTGAQEKTLAEYNVTVQVSPVQLTVNSVSSSSDSCNLTVTCSTEEDSQISSTFTCDTKTRCQEGGETSEITKSGAFLHVYLSDESIICNHSNHVSRTKGLIKIQDYCTQHDGSESLSGISFCLLKTAVFSVGLIIMVSAVITVHMMERLKKQE
ncbi:SLAM family member 5-like isoform X2 [Leuresthes tenuis]|uniref:SLAM family member 5-like isoform X2 n=1 Tax=Leuresthes tenuis TaxID=355514 RepID=UPI003B50E9BA